MKILCKMEPFTNKSLQGTQIHSHFGIKGFQKTTLLKFYSRVD